MGARRGVVIRQRGAGRRSPRPRPASGAELGAERRDGARRRAVRRRRRTGSARVTAARCRMRVRPGATRRCPAAQRGRASARCGAACAATTRLIERRPHGGAGRRRGVRRPARGPGAGSARAPGLAARRALPRRRRPPPPPALRRRPGRRAVGARGRRGRFPVGRATGPTPPAAAARRRSHHRAVAPHVGRRAAAHARRQRPSATPTVLATACRPHPPTGALLDGHAAPDGWSAVDDRQLAPGRAAPPRRRVPPPTGEPWPEPVHDETDDPAAAVPDPRRGPAPPSALPPARSAGGR